MQQPWYNCKHPKLKMWLSRVRTQHPPTLWNLRAGRWISPKKLPYCLQKLANLAEKQTKEEWYCSLPLTWRKRTQGGKYCTVRDTTSETTNILNKWNWLGSATGDEVISGYGDLAEDGQRVVRQQVQLGVPQLRVRHEPGTPNIRVKNS